MKQQKNVFVISSALAIAAAGLSLPASAADADAAQSLARQNKCFECHSVDKKKDGPAWKDVAAKYRGKADAQDKLVKHLTTGEMAKFPDGHEEEHKMVKTKDMAQIKNLVDWILALQ